MHSTSNRIGKVGDHKVLTKAEIIYISIKAIRAAKYIEFAKILQIFKKKTQ